jgi:phospholipase/carboxylesterase
VFGFSQGGAMALEGGCALPIAGLISCSGYPHPNWAPPQQHPPVLLMHGSDDPVVPFQAMQSIAAQLQPDQCQTVPFKNGHTIPDETVQPILMFIERVLENA